jgi:hypothetical protein
MSWPASPSLTMGAATVDHSSSFPARQAQGRTRASRSTQEARNRARQGGCGGRPKCLYAVPDQVPMKARARSACSIRGSGKKNNILLILTSRKPELVNAACCRLLYVVSRYNIQHRVAVLFMALRRLAPDKDRRSRSSQRAFLLASMQSRRMSPQEATQRRSPAIRQIISPTSVIHTLIACEQSLVGPAGVSCRGRCPLPGVRPIRVALGKLLCATVGKRQESCRRPIGKRCFSTIGARFPRYSGPFWRDNPDSQPITT